MSDNERGKEEDMQLAAELPRYPVKPPYYTGRMYTPKEVAKIFRVAPVTIYRWITEGRISKDAVIELPSKPGSKRRLKRIRGYALDELIFKKKDE